MNAMNNLRNALFIKAFLSFHCQIIYLLHNLYRKFFYYLEGDFIRKTNTNGNVLLFRRYSMSSSEVKIRTEEKAADLIVEELLREGVECVFGIVSIHNMPMYDALLRSNKIKIVNARGESGAVNMADGYARSTGKLGVVLTSTGAGAGNAAGALTEAWNAGTPLLHLTGDVASAFVGTSKRYIHECKDQLKMMDGACKTAIAVTDPTNIQTVVREAIKQTKAQPTGPITIQIPIDMQSKLVNRSIIQQEPQLNRGTFTLDSEVLSKIQSAKRPVLWVGGGVVKASAHRLLTQFAEQIGAAVITSESGKGAIPEDHPQCIGNYAATKPTIELLKSADLLISIGVRFRWNETGNYSVPIPDEHITINADALSINRNYDCQHALIGDAYDILDALTKQFEGESFIDKSSFLAEVTAVKVQVDRELREAMSPYGEIADHMRRVMPKDTIFVRDITLPAYQWGHRLIRFMSLERPSTRQEEESGRAYLQRLAHKLDNQTKNASYSLETVVSW